MPADNERILRVKQALSKNSLDALICKLPENILFLSGFWPLTGTSWAVFSAGGSCCIIVPACEAEEAKADGITDLSTYEWAHLQATDSEGEAKSAIAQTAKKFGIERGKIGIEENFESIAPPLNIGEPTVPAKTSKQLLQSALPYAAFIDATEIIHGLRVLKTPNEVEKLRIANEIAGFGLAAFKKNVKEGITEIELASIVNSEVMIKGSGYKNVKSARAFAQVSSAEGTVKGWRPCEITTKRKLQKGDLVLLELAVVADGFWADNTRPAVVGKPSEKQKQIHKLILKAQKAAMDRIKAGAKMSDVDKAARDIINDAGYGEYFIHITGHGIGWRYHEFPPLLHPQNDALLQEGMVTSVEPGVYIPGFGGIRIEDNVAVSKDGPDCLSTYSREL